MMEKEKDQGAINLSTAGKDTEPDGPITNGDISKATVEPDNTSQVCMDRYTHRLPSYSKRGYVLPTRV